MIDLYVYSRAAIEMVQPHEVPHVIISITSAPDDLARLRVPRTCDAGMSRSPAVAAALGRVLNGDDSSFFAGRYRPNMRVYRMMLDAAPTGWLLP